MVVAFTHRNERVNEILFGFGNGASPASDRDLQSLAPRPASRMRGVAAGLLLWIGLVAGAGAQNSEQPPSGQSPPQDEAAAPGNPLNLDLLLADPVADRPGFQALRERLERLAEGDGSPSAFEAAADELATDGIYTTAIEILWFAGKIAPDEAAAGEYAQRMQTWAQRAAAAESVVEEGEQLYSAGRKQEAIKTFLRALDSHPFSERAHFRLAEAWRHVYLEEYGNDLRLAPLEIRVRVFRDAYEHYRLALEIDPLFYDAYYGLSELRDMFPENQEFLLRTQPLTQRALDFRGEVLSVLEEIERGQEDAATFSRLGAAFETIGADEYAVFAWQCALRLGGPEDELRPRIEALQQEKGRRTGAGSDGGR